MFCVSSKPCFLCVVGLSSLQCMIWVMILKDLYLIMKGIMVNSEFVLRSQIARLPCDHSFSRRLMQTRGVPGASHVSQVFWVKGRYMDATDATMIPDRLLWAFQKGHHWLLHLFQSQGIWDRRWAMLCPFSFQMVVGWCPSQIYLLVCNSHRLIYCIMIYLP